MTGYEIYRLCRKLQKRNIPSEETYSGSKERGYYELLHEWSEKDKLMSSEDLQNYISVIYNADPVSFDPYTIMDEQWESKYIEWKKTRSTPARYFSTVRKSFDFITNFCISENISYDKYKRDWAAKHIRTNDIDGAVAVYLKLIDKRKLNKIQKLLLTSFLSQYNILVVRIQNPDLKLLLADLEQEMKRILEAYASMDSLKNNT